VLPTAGTGFAPVSYSVNDNTQTTAPHIGSILVAWAGGSTRFTVNQAGASCTPSQTIQVSANPLNGYFAIGPGCFLNTTHAIDVSWLRTAGTYGEFILIEIDPIRTLAQHHGRAISRCLGSTETASTPNTPSSRRVTKKARREIDKQELKARAVQMTEDWDGIEGLWTHKRTRRPKFDGKAFRTAHRDAAAACALADEPFIQRHIFFSRSY
jgi:hypothetical protein